ncbi:MAG: hydrogenase 3 maturation endopeptidase HyCI [Anaerolineae bacterium]|nr:hydrogenase 3 maturation endopeptidase HyCI [Anaerolineae bacterium]
MSNTSWQIALRQALEKLRTVEEPPRMAVIGIGHALRGDDAVGLEVVGSLRGRVTAADNLLVIDGGAAPENCTGTLRRFRPHLALLVDAAQLGEAPGTVQWLMPESITGYGGSTHTLPLNVFAAYLSAEFGCTVALLGIQAGSTSFGAPLSPAVRQAVDQTAQALADCLRATDPGTPPPTPPDEIS